MSLVMAYFLFWMIFIYKQECAVIRLDHHNRNAFEYVIQKYMNPLRKLSADLPNQAIEMEIEIHGSVPREVTNDPRRFIRTKNRRRPKPIPRAQDDPVNEEVTANGTATTANSIDLGQAASTPEVGAAGAGAVNELGAPAPPVGQDAEPSDPQKIPVFMEDLKKALDDLEKKLISKQECLTAATTSGQNLNPGAATPQPSSQPARSVDDIVKMLQKAVSVEHRMPKAGDEKLEWLRIKIPKSIKL